MKTFLALILISEFSWASVLGRNLKLRICQWEIKLERLPVSCLLLGKPMQGRCSLYHLRRTPAKRLAEAQTLKKLDPTCRQAVKREIVRRKYLSSSWINNTSLHSANIHQFFDAIPDYWQGN